MPTLVNQTGYGYAVAYQMKRTAENTSEEALAG